MLLSVLSHYLETQARLLKVISLSSQLNSVSVQTYLKAIRVLPASLITYFGSPSDER